MGGYRGIVLLRGCGFQKQHNRPEEIVWNIMNIEVQWNPS